MLASAMVTRSLVDVLVCGADFARPVMYAVEQPDEFCESFTRECMLREDIRRVDLAVHLS